jgi:Kef-type K+ transport system membrane component KefB
MDYTFPLLLFAGIFLLCSFYMGKTMKWVRLPSIIGFMIIGVLVGNMLEMPVWKSLPWAPHKEIFNSLSFITHVALALVALTIGMELSFLSLKKQGLGIITIIFAESFGAFLLVLLVVYLMTGNWPLALIFGAVAPASAPAGTVAVIQEYKAKGPLTKALYAVVGFDDGLGIIIFGFAAAIARTILLHETGEGAKNIFMILLSPLREVFLSLAIGIATGIVFCILGRKLKNQRELFILIVSFSLIVSGICILFHLSLILTNMILGMVIVNTQPHGFVEKIGEELGNIMPILYTLFFALAGANLHLAALPSLGLLGIMYIVSRSAGLVGGARIGAVLGKAGDTIKNYLGLGILSQAGVAIGLSLIVKQEFAGVGRIIEKSHTTVVTSGDYLGVTVITTVTATCIFFEIIGPILTKIGLSKAGEINTE